MATITDFNNLALAQTGVPYVFGGINLAGTPNPGLDCSGLPYAVSLKLGQGIPRTSESQFANLPRLSAPQRRGDLVFYDVASDDQAQPAHVTIWWTPQTVLQAPRTGEDVGIYPNSQLPFPIMGYASLPFPNVPPVPPPTPVTQEDDMIARNTAGSGYWCARANADIYAYGGAPYLGPLPKYTAQWGIGTPTNPVVGIVDDGAGGFVLETDNGGAQPNLYHITSNGQYAS
jgi:hypothetical protein